MDKSNKTTCNSPKLCTGGCGFYGSEHFQGLCSKCYGAKNKGGRPSSPKLLSAEFKPPASPDLKNITTDSLKLPEAILLSRKHPRPASFISEDPSQHTTSSSSSLIASSPTTTEPQLPTPPPVLEKIVQKNKGRCYKCRVKVPLAKQTINKCRCDFIFCDSHRFPERHDCEIDYAKMGRDILAKNNPKLRERPKGGTSFKRIDSL